MRTIVSRLSAGNYLVVVRFLNPVFFALTFLFAQDAGAIPAAPPGYEWKYVTRAVDANRKAHFATDYGTHHAPWADDVIHRIRPEYPYEDRERNRVGKGLYRLSLDLHTGAVTNVRIVRSAGSASLDASAMDSLRRWKFKPGKWLEVDIPIEFAMGQ